MVFGNSDKNNRYHWKQKLSCRKGVFVIGVHLKKSPNGFERMKYTHPKQWEYCMFKLGLAEVLDYIGVPWGAQMELEDYLGMR